MYIVKKFEIVFPLMSKIIIYFHVYIILNFPIIYRNASVLCQSDCTCLHKTVNMAVWFVKSNENTYPKRESVCANVQSCPINEKRELVTIIVFISFLILFYVTFQDSYCAISVSFIYVTCVCSLFMSWTSPRIKTTHYALNYYSTCISCSCFSQLGPLLISCNRVWCG